MIIRSLCLPDPITSSAEARQKEWTEMNTQHLRGLMVANWKLLKDVSLLLLAFN
jgi:hypothetical protein